MKPLTRTLLAIVLLLPACEAESPSQPMTLAPSPAPTGVPATAPPRPVTAASPLALSCQAEPRAGDTPLTVRFTAFPSGGTGSYDYLWDFGDGATSTARRPAHTYTTPGNWPARLTLTSGDVARHCERPIVVTGAVLAPAPTPDPGTGRLPDLVITIVGIAGAQSFSPNPAVARIGQNVIWQNADAMTHTATASGGAFNTGLLPAGAASTAVAPSTAGSFPYFCLLHAGMSGTLVVAP